MPRIGTSVRIATACGVTSSTTPAVAGVESPSDTRCPTPAPSRPRAVRRRAATSASSDLGRPGRCVLSVRSVGIPVALLVDEAPRRIPDRDRARRVAEGTVMGDDRAAFPLVHLRWHEPGFDAGTGGDGAPHGLGARGHLHLLDHDAGAGVFGVVEADGTTFHRHRGLLRGTLLTLVPRGLT